MRWPVAFLLTLLTAALSAQEVVTAGPRTFLGQPQLGPWNASLDRPPVLVSDGDETVVFWLGRRYASYRGIYALRLGRDGAPVTKQPAILLEGRERSGAAEGSNIGAVWADGLYTVFYAGAGSQLHAMRVTRELEIVSTHGLGVTVYGVLNAARSGDEIVVVSAVSIVRLGLDLAVRHAESRRYPENPWTPRSVTGSPRGPVVIAGEVPALTARYLDGGAPVRVGEVRAVIHESQVAWTGSEFVAVWLNCNEWLCDVRMARLDADLRMLAETSIATSYCFCHQHLGLTPLGDDQVLIAWSTETYTWAQRFRNGAALDQQPMRLPVNTAAIETANGSLLAVDGLLRTGALPPPGTVPVVFVADPAVEIAAGQLLLDAAGSDDEIAVAWRTFPGQKTAASIFTPDGRSIEELPLLESWWVKLASDGPDVYALVHGTSITWFQRLDLNAVPVQIDVERGKLAWAGDGFLAVRPKATERELIVIDRGGKVREACPGGSVPAEGLEAIVRGESELLLVGGDKLMRIRGGCASPVEHSGYVPAGARVAWHAGRWASLFTEWRQGLKVAIAAEGARFTANPRVIFPELAQHHVAAIAGVNRHWIVLQKTGATGQAGELHVALLDFDGNVVYRALLDSTTTGRPYLVPLSGTKVLAVYEQLDFAPPWLGERRIVMRTLTIENATRRRTVRH